MAAEKGSLDRGANDGQAFPCFQLIGQRQQTRFLHILLGINRQQNQDLRPDEKQSTQNHRVEAQIPDY